MKIMTSIVVLLFSLSIQAMTKKNMCTYKFLSGSFDIKWTGYKFLSKTPVSGTFKKIKFTQTDKANNISDLARTVKFEIKPNSIDSGLELRDKRLYKYILKNKDGEDIFKGEIKNFDLENRKAIFEIQINKHKFDLEMSFQLDKNEVIATGTFDLLQVGMKTEHSAIHENCRTLHTGPEGTPKTWSDVTIKVNANYLTDCDR